ncbi:MAG: hypothetical protein QW369_04500 [Desulfurococcaceae archaeon]
MEECVESIVLYLKSRVPGVLNTLDLAAQLAYSKGVMDLFLESPSKVYSLMLSYMNSASADLAFKLLFLNPLANCLKKQCVKVDSNALLRLVKLGNDVGFKKLVGGVDAHACRDIA